ncbi:MAG: UDP-N-acetylmuramoyl-L-alanine--D-glutamate ligase [Methylobacteriaceae bacterium]|nr:UDP-N-acetylmuramoyl-L-alanine--D-glutamate ligase [Methylobacteriaceae bacterium]
MTPVSAFAGRDVALFGLGGSGLTTAQALVAGGARVACWDDSAAQRDKAAAAGLAIEDLAAAEFSRFAALILTPGAPLTHPAPHWSAAKARAAGIEIIGDIELFCRERRARAPGAPFIAITGTNGKSTTTALIAHLLRAFGRDVALGGNIGTAILALPPPAARRTHVIECSSFQIDLAPSLDASVGVLLNLAPDHIDRHGTMEIYAAVKERLVAMAGRVVIGVDDAHARAIAARLAAAGKPVTPISAAGAPLADGVFARGSKLFRAAAGAARELADLSAIASLRGAHNAQNACAAIAAIGDLADDAAALQAALAVFPGLPHRMEEVGRLGRALFINDSKATNADAAEKALASFGGDIFWIVGGKRKEEGIEPLRRYFPRIARAFLIGAASEDFAATLEGAAPYERCGTLDVALQQAARAAAASDAREPVVLLSPACASYDQFPNFEVRGDRFRALARALIAQG